MKRINDPKNAVPNISLCMIAKNEEHVIGEALKSVASAVSEIILVDTGSTDRTKEIAKTFGAKVFEEPWEDDFSKPRNKSLQYATGDWILVLDADEVVDESDLKLLKALPSQGRAGYLFTQRHYSNDPRISGFTPCEGRFPRWEGEYLGYFESSLCRFFPNDKRIRYRNRVHELVEYSIHELTDLPLIRVPILLHHYGHTPEIQEKKKKSALYTPLGERKAKEEESGWKAFFELGVEHNCAGRLQESAQALKKSAELYPDYVPTWLNLGYVLTELGEYRAAHEALCNALRRDPKNPEVHCNLGVNYLRARELEKAEQHFRVAIHLRRDYVNAISNLGTVLMLQGRISEGAKVFRYGHEKAPKNSHLLLRFGHALFQAGILEEAKVVLEEVVKLAPREPTGWQLLGKTLEGMKLSIEAELAFQKAGSLES